MTDAVTLPLLYTDESGRARFAECRVPLTPRSESIALSDLLAATAVQFRLSPPGVQNDFHCTTRADCQLITVHQGLMAIGLRDGSVRHFPSGSFFLAMDFLPPGQAFNNTLHGHRSFEASGSAQLITTFVKIPADRAEQLLDQALLHK